jgi:protein-disulfide isomerase
MLRLDRRSFIAASAGVLLAGSPTLGQQTVDVEELYAPGQLGEQMLGSADAPVTVVEYASMSCPHCADFDRTTFDPFREKYIDTGKVRYIFREFPLNAPAYAVAMVARCAPADRFFDVVHAYFRSQDEWLAADDVKAAIRDASTDFGLTEQSFDACLSNQALLSALNAEKERAIAFGVQATPTFFINGAKFEGALTLEQLDKAIAPLL